MKKKKPFHMEMERTLSDSLQRHEKLAHAESWMVAVSGGVDSMVLLYFLITTKELHNKSIIVVHFNHQLRDQASEEDARWVENQCRILGVECVIGRGDVRSRAQESAPRARAAEGGGKVRVRRRALGGSDHDEAD